MGPMRWLVIAVGAGGLCLSSCQFDSRGARFDAGSVDATVGIDSASGIDAETVLADSSPTALCGPTQVHCGGTCIDGDDCTVCNSDKLLCKPTRVCVSDCQACIDPVSSPLPIECFACESNQDPDESTIGTCEPASGAAYCLNGDYGAAFRGGPGAHCDCSNTDPANCAGDTQVCVPLDRNDFCRTCGEADTDGRTCKGGGTCDTSVSPPACVP